MRLKQFTSSHHCAGGFHCEACRDREGGRTFRASLAKAFVLPDDAPDFACPLGHPWGFATPPAPERQPKGGPGTELRKLLETIGIRDVPGCKCKLYAAQMDARGSDWCEANVETIVGWLAEEAKRQGLPFVPIAGRLLVKVAIKRARQSPVPQR